MKDGFIVVSEQDWAAATAERRSWMVFNTLRSIEERLKALENRVFIEKFYSFAGGIFGGALAVWAYLSLKTIR